ncbi:cytochrome p450 [Moniliophthora roreri MCA 2997]|uniref:Cytochrome p450 n=1 Tax=Moniliophthora roreri (strain MCA 2997) TaxID=1381753 RepID=V2YSU5_MONRO|nr:cytochrome p450 [Moniliophthora roreri MCA 2997]
MESLLPLDVIASALAIYLLAQILRRKPRLPPGPPGYPIIGNIFDIPQNEGWIVYKDMSRIYDSEILHFNMAGTSVIVVNSFDIARELFEKRSSIYSDRPRFPMMNELIGFDWHLGFMPYGDSWRDHRKLFHQEFQPPATLRHRPNELQATRHLLGKLLRSPSDFERHLRHMAGMIILSAAYGIDIQPQNDPYVAISEQALHAMACAGNNTAFLVDQLPFLKYVPEWFPGANFKRQAREWRETVSAMPQLPMDFVRRSTANGNAKDCIATRVLESMHEDGSYSPEKEQLLQNVLAAIYAAGADTTVSALGTFILAMVLNPEIQKKGQAAVDEVTGGSRLPDFSDHHSIPYVDAMVKEVLRWKPVTPLAVPHLSTSDDEYKGYFIPKGSVVIGNSWAMLYDESLYGPRTDQYNPDRFMKDGELNPDIKHPEMAFGFGRRQCPGQDMAESSIWITIASILACFDISKAVDENGVPIEPSGEYTSGMLCYPCPFPCTIHPRSSRAEVLISEGMSDL